MNPDDKKTEGTTDEQNFMLECETEGDFMWKIKQIFDGDYGCEELTAGEKPKVSVTLVNEASEERYVSVEDDWLIEHDLDEGSTWPINICG